jgi:hypothetical protein
MRYFDPKPLSKQLSHALGLNQFSCRVHSLMHYTTKKEKNRLEIQNLT